MRNNIMEPSPFRTRSLVVLACAAASHAARLHSEDTALDAHSHHQTRTPTWRATSYSEVRRASIFHHTGDRLNSYDASEECDMPTISDSELLEPLAPRSRGSVLWSHVHKCAGTSICELARTNEENMTGFQGRHNCNSCGDTCRVNATVAMCGQTEDAQCAYSGDISCSTRMHMAAQQSFMGQERFVDADLCTNYVTHGIMLREPLDRLISNTKYARSYGWDASAEEIVDMVTPGTPVHEEQSNDCDNCGLVERSTFAYDNMFIRTLLGKRGMQVRAGELTRDDLEQAKVRLASYSVVLILDEYDDHTPQLKYTLGWNVTSLEEENTGGDGTVSDSVFTDDQLRTLADANALDYELYCFGRSLAAARTAQALEARKQQQQQHAAAGQTAVNRAAGHGTAVA